MGTRDVSTLTHYGKDPLTLESDGTITYSRATPQAFNDLAFKITGNGIVGLVGAGERIGGRIVLSEESDGQSVKVNCHFKGVLPFRYSGTAPTPGQAIIGAANGFVTGAAQGTANARGEVVQVFPADNIVTVAI